MCQTTFEISPKQGRFSMCRQGIFLMTAIMSGFLMTVSSADMPAGRPNYPPSKTVAVADTLFGHIIPDPYRWLEDTDSANVQQWTDQQNALTRSYLDNIPARADIKAKLEKLWNYPKQTTPTKCDKRYFYSQNDGLQNHYVIYAKAKLTDKQASIVIDPNSWSTDGTDAMNYWIPTEDGQFIAYGHSQKGAERGTMYIRDVATGQDLAELFSDMSYPSVAWLKDNSGFFYTRNPAKGTVPPGDENYFEKLFFHKIGDDPAQDKLIYERPDIKELGLGAHLSHDYRYLFIYGYKGSSTGNEVYFKNLAIDGPITNLISGFDTRFRGEAIGDKYFAMTNNNAPNFKIVVIDLINPTKENWQEIIPESKDILDGFQIINGRIVASYLHNACSTVRIFDLDGKFSAEIPLPELGSVGGISGRWDDDEMYFDFDSFTYPGTIFSYDFKKNRLEKYYQNPVKVDPSGYETKQVWYNSKDGTPISMFVVHKKGLKLDGNNPTLLYGYGGFTANMTPYFSSTLYIWLEKGGVYAMPNTRGGGEYGESWHKAGMLDKKQNVFDDFIFAAQWLIDNKYTRPEKLAIRGGSNGGLLVGAVMVQRPELFGAVLCGAPLLDMVRYHMFNIARYWIPEYGSSEDSTQLPFILTYSPYHNVKKGIAYPAVLFQAGETDWRTHPLHPRKMAAILQASTSSDAPILLDMERKTGHGWGMPLSMQLEKYADEWAFLFWRFGVE